jgi:hypothetical protein
MQQRPGNVNIIFFTELYRLLRAEVDSETEGGIFLKRFSQGYFSNPADEKYAVLLKKVLMVPTGQIRSASQ